VSGYFSGGTDLDALFMARVNAARAAVGYQVAGVDLAQRFEPIGGGTPRAAVGRRRSREFVPRDRRCARDLPDRDDDVH
jgi:hypothetical protein